MGEEEGLPTRMSLFAYAVFYRQARFGKVSDFFFLLALA
jgi:hypothetical protein